jgi:hypothetical protein
MIEDFLARRTTAKEFSSSFFRAFQADNTHWGGELYDALNAVATAAECYEPGVASDEFDVTEEELRAECRRRLAGLREVARDVQG